MLNWKHLFIFFSGSRGSLCCVSHGEVSSTLCQIEFRSYSLTQSLWMSKLTITRVCPSLLSPSATPINIGIHSYRHISSSLIVFTIGALHYKRVGCTICLLTCIITEIKQTIQVVRIMLYLRHEIKQQFYHRRVSGALLPSQRDLRLSSPGILQEQSSCFISWAMDDKTYGNNENSVPGIVQPGLQLSLQQCAVQCGWAIVCFIIVHRIRARHRMLWIPIRQIRVTPPTSMCWWVFSHHCIVQTSAFIADPLHLLCNYDDDMSNCPFQHDQSANDTWSVVISKEAKNYANENFIVGDGILRDNTLDSGTKHNEEKHC